MKKYELVATTKFKKDLKKIIKRGYDIELLDTVVETLLSGEPLDIKYKDHALMNSTPNIRQCDIMSNIRGDFLCQKESQTKNTQVNLNKW